MKPQAAPLITGYALACVVIFVLLWLTGFQIDAIMRAGFIPARFGSELILPPGTMVPFVLTPLSSAFLHGGVLHIAFNMLVLLFIGRQLEAPLGSKAMAVLLVAGAYGGALAQYLADPASVVPMIGASGAISALIAVFALIFSRSQASAIGPIPGHWVRALWLAA
ncbi:MAG TPA: rhomboid family intramembrane serine protease, partial [Sphingopyxis sp.]|nr:rhomboid family intramembrane serine protease [Sphingopyxis sp.]